MTIEFHELCPNCYVRKGTRLWSGHFDNINAMRHFKTLPKWCELCCVRAQLEYAERLAANIPELKQKEIQRPSRCPNA